MPLPNSLCLFFSSTKCPSCSAKFFKTEGCNKMTCSCGTTICYICRVEITKLIGKTCFSSFLSVLRSLLFLPHSSSLFPPLLPSPFLPTYFSLSSSLDLLSLLPSFLQVTNTFVNTQTLVFIHLIPLINVHNVSFAFFSPRTLNLPIMKL
jgi:hypothetical protein